MRKYADIITEKLELNLVVYITVLVALTLTSLSQSQGGFSEG